MKVFTFKIIPNLQKAEFGSVLSGYPFYLYPFYPDIQPIYPDIIWIIWLLSGYPANFSGYPADILLLLFLFKSIYQIYLILSVVNGMGKVQLVRFQQAT